MFKPLYAPDGNPILRPSDFSPSGIFGTTRAQRMSFRPADFLSKDEKELAADYAAPVVGVSPNGLGFNFGDSFRRTGRGVMEFNLPTGQTSTINESLRWAAENVFVGKAMRLKTDFTCKGLRNASADDAQNTFFDSVLRKLSMYQAYRQGVWLYYTVGLVPILTNEPDTPLSFCQILDPRYVVVEEWYGKKYMYMKPDERMMAAIMDPKGTTSPFNKDYWDAMPKEWKKQIAQQQHQPGFMKDKLMIRLTPGSYTVIDNRSTRIERATGCWDGAPLQPYFSACQQYRQLAGGDFAASFLAKNLLALVSVGDPKAEGDNYMRPDGTVLAGLQAGLQNPNSAQFMYVDPTFNVRYITPDVDTFSSTKYDEPRGQLQELLPNCFWSGEEGSFANSATSLKSLQEEVDACNGTFDQNFFRFFYERAAERNPRISKRAAKTPLHDRSSLLDPFQWLQAQSALYANGGMPIRTLVEAHGYDYDAVVKMLQDEKKEVKKGTFVPAFESKQGIVAGVLEKAGVIEDSANEPTVPKTPLSQLGQLEDGTPVYTQPSNGGSAKTGKAKRTRSKRKTASTAKGGRPTKVGNAARPQPETNSTKAPRPKNAGGKK